MKELMEEDTVLITILRNPVSQFESTFSYMQFAQLLGIQTARPMETFFEDPTKIMSKISNISSSKTVFSVS